MLAPSLLGINIFFRDLYHIGAIFNSSLSRRRDSRRGSIFEFRVPSFVNDRIRSLLFLRVTLDARNAITSDDEDAV